MLWWGVVVGIRHTGIAYADLLASTQGGIAKRAEAGHLAIIVIASQIDDIRGLLGRVNDKLTRNGYSMGRTS